MKFAYIILAIVVIGGVLVLLTNRDTTNTLPANTEETGAALNSMEDIEEEGVMNAEVEVEDTMIEADVNVSADADVGETKVFNVSGSNFAFDVNEIRVNEGDTVTINFEATEGFHDWVVDEFDAATDQVRPGTPTSVTFVADAAGVYEYYCAVGNHRAQGMVGTLIVE